jgi:anaerobic selenocysteine-containing dehydrogenase
VLFDLLSTTEGRHQSLEISQRWFGERQLPIYDIARTEVIFSFGANFLETWMSPVAQSVDYGIMRQGQLGGRGFLAQFEPRLSSTAASADEWIAVRPGTEGLIALGLGRIIVEEGLGRVGSHREHAHLYRDINVGEIAEASGLPVERIRELAQVFADADRSVAIPGGQLAGHSNGQQAMDAVMALNVIMRRLGREGGVFLPRAVPAEGFPAQTAASNFADVTELIGRMHAGKVEVLFIHSANPVYEIPRWTKFQQALAAVPLVISFSPFVDETAANSDLILPDHTYLEAWGFRVPSPGADRPTVSSFQPVVRSLYDTRSAADVLLELAGQLGGDVAEALPWTDEVNFLEEACSRLLGSSVGLYDAKTPAGFWSRWRQHGGWWSEKSIRVEPEAVGVQSDPLRVPLPKYSGDPSKFGLHLVPFPSITLSDGRGANQPLLQEAADPMTTARWNTWVEINPQTAQRLGISDHEVVRVISEHGELAVPAVLYPGIRPDSVAMPLGQGHEDYGRFAEGRGANPLDLLAPSTDQGQLQWGATLVRIEPTGEQAKLARLESLEGEGRESIR